MWGEPYYKKREREERMKAQYPELQYGEPEEIMRVDNQRLTSGGGPLSTLSQMTMRLAAHAAEEARKKREEEERRKQENRTRPADPYGPEAMALPGVEDGAYDESRFKPRAAQQAGLMAAPAQFGEDEGLMPRPPIDTSYGAGGIANMLSGSLLDNQEGLPGPVQNALNTPVVGQGLRELARPANWLAAAAAPLSFAPRAGFGVRLGAEAVAGTAAIFAGEETYEATEGLPEPLRVGLAGGAGILAGGVSGGVSGLAGTRAFTRNTFEEFSRLPREAIKVSDQLADDALKPKSHMLMAGADDAVRLDPADPNSATQRLFAMQPTKPGLNRVDRVMNAVKNTIGIGVPEEDIATPIMRERRRVQANVDSQATRLGAAAQDTARAFKVDKEGRITSLPGEPTIQDLAAKLPMYWERLNPQQQQAILKLQSEVAPYGDSLAELGIDVNRRADVMEGGFYLPRGRADIEGADVPIKVGSGRRQGKKGFEKAAVFDSMTEGIENGYEYAPLHEALESYGREAGNRALDQWAASQFKASGLGETVADRTNPQLRIEVETLRSKIATRHDTLVRQWARQTPLDREAARAQRVAERGEELAGNAQGRVSARHGQSPDPIGPDQFIGRDLSQLSEEDIQAVLTHHRVGWTPQAVKGVKSLLARVQRAGKWTPEDTRRLESLTGLGSPPRSWEPGIRVGSARRAPKDDFSPFWYASKADEPTDVVLERAERELKILEREARKQAARAERAGMRAEANRIRRELTGAAYDRLREEMRDLNVQWQRAKERAAQTPRDQGSIGLSALNGTTFPDAVANVANKYLNAEEAPKGRGTVLITAGDALNTLLRGIQATADVSFMAIQGALGAVSHPVAYSRALVTGLRALVDDDALGAFINHFDARARSHGKLDSRSWASSGLRIGASSTEFETGRGIGGIAGRAIRGAPIIKQSNRAFGVFGDALRLETADAIYDGHKAAAQNLGPLALRDIARGANLITGWSQNDLSSAGPLLAFAPRFFRSQLDLVGHAFVSGHAAGRQSATGDEARRALIRLMGVGTAITVGANEARGIETDFDPNSPNFMRITNVGGQDISLFGPWDSFLRAILVTATEKDPTYLARTKASPVVALAWDYFSGESFIGATTREGKMPTAEMLRRLLPFSLQELPEAGVAAVEEARAGDATGALGELAPIGVGMTGLKSTPMTPTERLDTIAQESGYEKDFWDLEPHQRAEVLKANPELDKQQLERGSDQRQEAEAARARYQAQQKAIDEQFLKDGDIGAWKEGYDDIRNRRDGALSQIYLDNPKREPDPDKPWELYGKVISDNTDPVTGEVDWDKVDEWRAANGDRPFDENRTWNDAIDDNVGVRAVGVEKEYREVGSELRKLGYFELRDKAWDDLKAQNPGAIDQWDTYYDWYDEELQSLTDEMLAKGVPKETAREEAETELASYGTVRKFSEYYRTQYRHQFVVDNKDLALQAVYYGYLDPDSAERKFLRSTP